MWRQLEGGYLTITSGTPVKVSSVSVRCHGVKIQQVNGNTKPIYLLSRSDGSYATGVGVLCAVPAPSYNTSSVPISLPYESAGIAHEPTFMDLQFLWIDGEHSGDKVMVSILEA